MPIGYQKGRSYYVDREYDRHADLDVFKRLHREAGKLGFGGHVTYSAMTRGYCCEVRKLQDLTPHSVHRYYTTEGHKYAPTPLEATVNAFRQCLPHSPILAALYLEAEMHLLTEAVSRARRLEKALDELEAVLTDHAESLVAAYRDVYGSFYQRWSDVIANMPIGEEPRKIGKSPALAAPYTPDEDDDL